MKIVIWVLAISYILFIVWSARKYSDSKSSIFGGIADLCLAGFFYILREFIREFANWRVTIELHKTGTFDAINLVIFFSLFVGAMAIIKGIILARYKK